MARERIPVVGHLGMVLRHVTWTGYRAIGRTVEEATQVFHKMKELETAGAYAAELEVVPHNLARFLSAQTKMLLMSRGSGPGRGGGARDKRGTVSLGRANFAAEHRRLQQERLAAFREYIADVQEGRFPERGHLVEMEAPFLDEVVRSIGGVAPHNEDRASLCLHPADKKAKHC